MVTERLGIMSESKKHHFKAWEDQIIKDKWQTSTDEQIAKEMGRTMESVARRRKILGFTKRNGRPGDNTKRKAILTSPTEYSLATLSKDDRIKFYKSQFTRNHRYPFLVKMLIEDEIPYYQHKYVEFLDNIDSITLQEEEILHNMIMTEIHILRLQEQIKDAVESYRDNDDDDKVPPPQYLYTDLDKAENRYSKYHQTLSLTREQRLKTDSEEKITMTGMVTALQEVRNKNKAGRNAGLMSYFTKRCREDMNKMSFLLGGDKPDGEE